MKSAANPQRMAEKYAALHRISLGGAFVAPRVLDVGLDSVVLEKITDLVSIRDIYIGPDTTAACDTLNAAGFALGLIHRELPKAPGSDWTEPEGFSESLVEYLRRRVDIEAIEWASLHCDYSFANVFVRPQDRGRVVIIDPCANYGSTFDDWTFGPVLLDVGKMLACLEGQVPARLQVRRPSGVGICRMQQQFLTGYEKAADRTLDRELAHAFGYAVARAQFRRRYGPLGLLHTVMLYNRAKRNFPAAAKMNRQHEA